MDNTTPNTTTTVTHACARAHTSLPPLFGNERSKWTGCTTRGYRLADLAYLVLSFGSSARQTASHYFSPHVARHRDGSHEATGSRQSAHTRANTRALGGCAHSLKGAATGRLPVRLDRTGLHLDGVGGVSAACALLEDHMRSLLSDHKGRRGRLAADNLRHRRRVNHT